MNRSGEGLWPRVTHAISSALSDLLPPSRRELEENYLNEAKDIYELEYRMRELDRGTPRLTQFAGHYIVH